MAVTWNRVIGPRSTYAAIVRCLFIGRPRYNVPAAKGRGKRKPETKTHIQAKSMGRKPLDHDLKREEIARATGKVIVERGLLRVKLGDIAESLGVTTGTLQHYFDTKDELLRHTKDLFVDERVRAAVESARAKSGLDRLQAMSESMVPMDQAGLDMWMIVLAYLGSTIGNPEFMDQQVLRYKMVQDLFAEEIASLQVSGHVREDCDPDIEAFALVSFVEGLAIQIVFSLRSHSQAQLADLVARYIDSVLGRPTR
jgi:AcrR family transcriptional regulator